MYQELFFRNQDALSKEEQGKLQNASIAIIGLGGTGGFALENLLRVGVEDFILFDGDRFELSNMNRQTLCSIPALDQPKAEVAENRATQINPSAKVERHAHFTAENMEELERARIVLDCTDRAATHVAINEACNAQRIPQVFATCNYSRGIVSVLENDELRKMLQLPQEKEKLGSYHQCTSILAPAATIAGGLAAAQAMAYLLGKPYVHAQDVLMFDLFREKMFWTERLE